MSNSKEFRYEWIWEKSIPTGFLNANRMPLKAHEQVLVFYRSLPTFHPQKVKGTLYKRAHGAGSSNYGKYHSAITESDEYYPKDIIKAKSIRHASDPHLHPTQKPVSLLEYLICTYTDPGETVLDNTMGSGSTGVACANTGRDFIGMELDPGYFEIAQMRIKAHGGGNAKP